MNAQRIFTVSFQFILEISSRLNKQRNGGSCSKELIPTMFIFNLKSLNRYAIISKQTWPAWRGDPRAGIKIVMEAVNMDTAEYQLGKSKVFIKTPESV